jgi:hypothetical protein
MDVALAAPHAPGFSKEVDVASAEAIGDSLRTTSPEKDAISLVPTTKMRRADARLVLGVSLRV